MLIFWVVVILAAFYLLAVVTDEFFVVSLDLLGKKLRMTPDMVGATLMAMGSSAPELFTSLIAVLRGGGVTDIGTGTIVGSAIFNILVIIGASALFREAKLNWQPVVRDTLFYVLSIVVLLISFIDGQIVWREALLFVSLYVGYLFAVMNWRDWFPFKDDDPIELMVEEKEKHAVAVWSRKALCFVIPDCEAYPKRYPFTFLVSILVIVGLSFVMVEAAVHVSEILHIPAAIVALTVLAAGTSIPDLLASMAVAKQGRGDMAISNAVGSNVFDILIGLGVPWLIVLSFGQSAVPVSNDNLMSSILLLFATVIAVFFLLFIRKWRIGKRAGWLLIGLYLLYVCWNVWQVL